MTNDNEFIQDSGCGLNAMLPNGNGHIHKKKTFQISIGIKSNEKKTVRFWKEQMVLHGFANNQTPRQRSP